MSNNTTAVAINGTRLWQSLMTLAKLGATAKGGVRRLALTDLDRQARDLVAGWLAQAGCQIHVDAIGNIFALRTAMAEQPDAPAVAVGSHIDTQPSGGRFDGAYGVLAGLELIRTLNDANIRTQRPLAVAIWTNEEGSRFTPVMMGSGVFADAFSLAYCHEQLDRDGVSVAQALKQIGYLGSAAAPRFAAYFEPHIEQGPILERESCTIGVVEGALGQRWFDASVTGQDAHAGPTPIELRKDALLAAAKFVIEVRRVALQYPDYARATVGQMHVLPNSRNVIPGRVDFTIDLRNARDETLNAMVTDLQACAQRISQSDDVTIQMKQVVYFPPCQFSAEHVDAIERYAIGRGYRSKRLASGAGHDAVYVARTCPTAMIFIPCDGGISHNEIENAQPADIEAGCNVLLDCVLSQSMHL
jgi:beta-ureidopropionase / N-carbamoyl-L-amino-acid hydrolase